MTDHYAVIGRPINHTKSPVIHGLFASTTGQDLHYGALEGSLEDFAGDVARFRTQGGRGMNVTAPFKLQAFQLATESSERARLARAANSLKFEGERVLAENFDGIGLRRDIEVNLGQPWPASACCCWAPAVRCAARCCPFWRLALRHW